MKQSTLILLLALCYGGSAYTMSEKEADEIRQEAMDLYYADGVPSDQSDLQAYMEDVERSVRGDYLPKNDSSSSYSSSYYTPSYSSSSSKSDTIYKIEKLLKSLK